MNNNFRINGHIINKNVTRPESASTKTIPSLANTASSSFSSILFVTNQSGTNFNAARQASTALAHISGALYLSRQYFTRKRSSKTTLPNIS